MAPPSIDDFYTLKYEMMVVLELLKSKVVEIAGSGGSLWMMQLSEAGNDVSKASSLVDDALDQHKMLGEDCQVDMLKTVGRVKYQLQQFAESFDCFSKAYKMIVDSDGEADDGDDLKLLELTSGIMLCYEHWGRYEEAISFGNRTIAVVDLDDEDVSGKIFLLSKKMDELADRLHYSLVDLLDLNPEKVEILGARLGMGGAVNLGFDTGVLGTDMPVITVVPRPVGTEKEQ